MLTLPQYLRSQQGGGAVGPFPPKPTRAEIENVQTNIGNLVDMHHMPILPTFVMSAPANMRRDWYQRMLAAGSTHYPVAIRYFYHQHEFPYPWYDVAGKDWIDDLRGWVQAAAEILAAGFKALHIFWTEGNGSWQDPLSQTRMFCDPSSPTYGPRLVTRVREACLREGLPDLTEYAISLIGFEPDPGAIDTCIPVLRQALGPDRDIALHLQQGYADPYGDGTRFWSSPVGKMIQFMFFQSLVCYPNTFDEYGQPSYRDNMISIMCRLLPTGTTLPGTHGMQYLNTHVQPPRTEEYPGYATGPDWCSGAPIGDRPIFVWYEGVAYYYTWRTPVTPSDQAWVDTCASQGRLIGVQRFGNGVPR